MSFLSRRKFIGSSLAGFAIASTSIADQVIEKSKPGHNPDTLFLTWQRDPTTTMTVQWIGPKLEAEDSIVHYCLANFAPGAFQAGQTALSPYPFTNLMVHRAELTGLTPGTDYLFRVGTGSKTFRFRTMPAKANDTIQFVSGGDCGTGSHCIGNNLVAAGQDPMFAVIGGDLAYENGRSFQTHLDFIRNYSKTMITREGRLIPMIACIGNHEVEGGYSTSRLKAPFFYAMFDGIFRDTGYATLDFGDYLSLILLDTGHTSTIGGDQSDWLEKRLRERVDHPNVMIVNHVPAYPSARDMNNTGNDNRKYWVPLFEKYRVPVVLEHHDHTFKRSKKLIHGLGDDNGVLYLGDGSWGQLRALQKPEKLSHLALASQDYHISLHRIEGNKRFHLALAESGRIMDISQTGQRTQGIVRTRSSIPGG